MNNRFSGSQKLRIRNIIFLTIVNWQQHYVETAATGLSSLAACTDKYAERGLMPSWFTGIPFTNGADALNFAMDILTSRFRDNGFRRVRSYINYYVPTRGEKPTAFAFPNTSHRRRNASLSVKLNQAVIDDQTLTNLVLVGSLFHAWLHRSGYRHPEDVYTSYLIGEAPMCIMRGRQDKVPGQPDTVRSRFLD